MKYVKSPPCESPAGGFHSSQYITATGSADAYMNGWRRPQRECRWSEAKPMTGSIIASATNASMMPRPTHDSGRPRTWL